MDVRSESPHPDPRQLARRLTGAESELSREAREMLERGVGDPEAWSGLLEQAAELLRRLARELEQAPAFQAGDADRHALPERGPALASSDGVVSGSAAVIPVSELLAFLSALRRTGMLWVETEREGFLVQTCEGAVVYAQGDNPPRDQLLGEILVADGALERARLEQAVAQAADGKVVLGAWLVRQGLVTQEQLTRALSTQVQMIFDRMFGALDARWQYEDGVAMVDSVDVRLNVIQLLLESARASDESHAREALDLGLPLASVAA
jgi:hypothetical protein